MKKIILLTTCVFLSGCFKGGLDLSAPDRPQLWTAKNSESVNVVEAPTLKNWWQGFNDPVLNQIVELTLAQSPDRLTAEAKILEARGLRRSSRSGLFPQIGASGNSGRQESGVDGAGSIDDFYEAGFDASFEIDIFGRNRNTYSAAGARLDAAEASYRDVTLTLIAETVRTYIDYRAAQNQYRIALKNLQSQEKTLTLIQDLNRLGSAPRLDVERTENLVNTTRASLPEFMRQAENAKLRLSVLTGGLPAMLAPVLSPDAEIPGGRPRGPSRSWSPSCRSFMRSSRPIAARRRSSGIRPSGSSIDSAASTVTRAATPASRTPCGPGGKGSRKCSCRCRTRWRTPRPTSAKPRCS